ncbi:hypothetical protein Q8F55_002715 [Vanrija albida]|uniref:DUF4050 domain-containing protein n=1 Tax=Vanrija albida TaxID=181172 RepID=A0ABR3QAN2_9TREE
MRDCAACAAAIGQTGTRFVGVPANGVRGNNAYTAYTDAAALIPANMSRAVRDAIPENYLAALVEGWNRSGQDRKHDEWATQFVLCLKL